MAQVLAPPIKGRFRKKGGFGECALVPVFVPGEHAKVPSFRLPFWGNSRTYPRSSFRSGGTSAKTTLLEDHPYFDPDKALLSGPVLRNRVFGVSTWPIGCDTLSPFSERFPPWRACEVEVRYPALKRGISAIPARYPMKTRQMGAIPPSATLSRKGLAR